MNKNIQNTIGSFLKQKRKSSKLIQEEFAIRRELVYYQNPKDRIGILVLTFQDFRSFINLLKQRVTYKQALT